MNIASLQSLLAQLNGTFNGQATLPAATAKVVNGSPAKDKTAANPASGHDKVNLSPEAQAYLKAHTLPSGKFFAPNMFDDLMTSLDPNNISGEDPNSSNGSLNLLDYLNAPAASNPQAAVVPAANASKPLSSANVEAALNSLTPLNSLTDFLK